MMLGNILWNFWFALGSFSVYFLWMFQKSNSPFDILIGSFICSLVVFVAMFGVRYLIGYILFTPEENENINSEEKIDFPTNDNHLNLQNKKTPKKEISESPEEIAKVVRTLMSE